MHPSYQEIVMRSCAMELYKQSKNDISDRLEDLSAESRQLQPHGNPGFRYKNNSYCAGGVPPYVLTRLHAALTEKMEKILADREELAEEERVVTHFIRKCLNQTRSYSDLVALLPKKTHQFWVHKFAQHPEESTNFSSEYLLKFHAEHEETIDLINQRVLINILLG